MTELNRNAIKGKSEELPAIHTVGDTDDIQFCKLLPYEHCSDLSNFVQRGSCHFAKYLPVNKPFIKNKQLYL